MSKGRYDPISTSPERLKQASNETPNDVSMLRYQDVSEVCIHDVTLVRLYNVFWNSQMKHPKRRCVTSPLRFEVTLLQRLVSNTVSTTFFKLICHDLHLVGFHILFKYQIQHQIFLVPTSRKTRGARWVIN